MSQVLLAALLLTMLGISTADKRPFDAPGRPFAFQRQQAETEDLSPPASPGAAGGSGSGGTSGDDASTSGGPYPPSSQPESGPYPPSGWKPEARLELPPRASRPSQQQWGAKQLQKQPQQQYGPPPKQPQQQYGPPPKQPQQKYGPPPKQPQQQYGPPPKQPQQQYGPPPKQPQQQYGPPPKQPPVPAEPEATETPAADSSTETPDQVAVNNKLRQQLRQQRVVLQRLRLQVREQQSQLDLLQQLRGVDSQRLEQQQLSQAAQGQYVVSLPDGRFQKVQYASTPSSASVFRQNVSLRPGVSDAVGTAGSAGEGETAVPPTYVARLQFMDVSPIQDPVFSYSGSAPLVQVA